MKAFNRTEITVKGPQEDHEITIFLPWDANIEDWEDAFKTILTHQTFAPELIKELFYDESKDRPLYTSPYEDKEFDPETVQY